ncbi:MAG TPA: hypothetical protein PK771_14905, partial [Spirochaetota bacterium]|nr:hypothetical protein [Spirochaetota bacterium]
MSLTLSKKNTIYIACPANTATGGPELLHQLFSKLRELDFNVKIYYYNCSSQNPVHEQFIGYTPEYVDKINDEKNNVLIVPEVATEILTGFRNISKVIWWLSVDNFFNSYKIKKIFYGILFNLNNKKNQKKTLENSEKIKMRNKYNYYYKLNFKNDNSIIHFVQSYYAYLFLKRENVNNIYFLSDYINPEFINNQLNKSNLQKENIALYNPNKGYFFTKKLIKCYPDINWIPLINLKRNEMSNLLLKAKVYIDFGEHPGKDRIPRESAISGCCVITGLKGSAKYHNDVPIKLDYK